MREIKFRCWDKEFKRFSDYPLEHPVSDINYLTDYEWMQYTGLKDKDGKEIFEGDTIQFTWDSDSCWGKAGTYIGYVRFDGGVFEIVYIGKVREHRIKERTECYDNIKSFMDWTVEVKVIGNIYERPELLECKYNV